jgi:Zn-dependent protease with chaperone function
MSGDEREGERPGDSDRDGSRPGPLGGQPGFQPPLPEPRANFGGDRPVKPGGAGLLLAELVNSVIRVLLGYFIIFWLSQFLGLGNGGWVVLVLWTLSGLIVVWPGVDDLLARYLFGLRRPTLVESQRLAPSWFGVGQRVGIDPRPFSMWIQTTEVPTAAVAGGRTVAATSWAVNGLPPGHLEAVLAFDYATHLQGTSWIGRLLHWYSAPARLVGSGIRRLLRLSRTIPAVGCTIVGFLIVSYIGIFMFVLVFYDGWTIPLLYLSPLLLPAIFAGLGKWTERMADRAVADLGLGRKLLEVLYGWQAQHQQETRRIALTQPDWLSGQPTVAERIRALELYLQRV